MAAELRIVRAVADVREAVDRWRGARETVAFVPTMGSLHAGHVSLTELAARTADRVVVSIFVNPTQFAPGEDFAAYPRTLEEDAARLSSGGTADLLFVPSDREIYPFGIDDTVRIVMPALSRELCGASRPGHFDGVATVVCRLLNIVMPNVLILGEKDYQQFKLMERMVADLRMPVTLLMAPTLREPDGVAMSSRNRYLDARQRHDAAALRAALITVRDALRAGAGDFTALEAQAREQLSSAGLRPDYVEVRRAADLLKPSAGARPEELIVLGAAWLGRARLIDNARV